MEVLLTQKEALLKIHQDLLDTIKAEGGCGGFAGSY